MHVLRSLLYVRLLFYVRYTATASVCQRRALVAWHGAAGVIRHATHGSLVTHPRDTSARIIVVQHSSQQLLTAPSTHPLLFHPWLPQPHNSRIMSLHSTHAFFLLSLTFLALIAFYPHTHTQALKPGLYVNYTHHYTYGIHLGSSAVQLCSGLV